jgi:hypothetical protein
LSVVGGEVVEVPSEIIDLEFLGNAKCYVGTIIESQHG